MTIIKVAADKPYKPPDPEVGGPLQPKSDSDSERFPVPVAIAVRKPAPSRRCTGIFTLFLIVACGLITIGLITGLYVWHQNYGERRGFCGVDYMDGDSRAVFMENVRIPSDDVEIVDVPKIGRWEQARVLHDFGVGKTAIEDVLKGRCFVMDLDRSVVKPPSSVWELIVKLRRGDYMPNAEVIRRTMRVKSGPLTLEQLREFGDYITEACITLDTYTLAPVNEADRILDREPRGSRERRSAKKAEYGIWNGGDQITSVEIELN